MSESEQEELQWRRRSFMPNHHHQWCIDFDKVIEGSCSECERLNRIYPSEGTLYYPDGQPVEIIGDL